jgi:hypothetical protein
MKLLCTFILVHILMLLRCSSTKRTANSRRKKRFKEKKGFPYLNNITQQINTLNDLWETLFFTSQERKKKNLSSSLEWFDVQWFQLCAAVTFQVVRRCQKTIDTDLLCSTRYSNAIYPTCIYVRILFFYGCRRRNIAEL